MVQKMAPATYPKEPNLPGKKQAPRGYVKPLNLLQESPANDLPPCDT